MASSQAPQDILGRAFQQLSGLIGENPDAKTAFSIV